MNFGTALIRALLSDRLKERNPENRENGRASRLARKGELLD